MWFVPCSRHLAVKKSHNFKCIFSSRRRFSGLISRWMISWLWRYSIARSNSAQEKRAWSSRRTPNYTQYCNNHQQHTHYWTIVVVCVWDRESISLTKQRVQYSWKVFLKVSIWTIFHNIIFTMIRFQCENRHKMMKRDKGRDILQSEWRSWNVANSWTMCGCPRTLIMISFSLSA